MRAAANSILTCLHDGLRDRQRRIGAATLSRAPSLARRFLDEHAAILDAIRRRDPNAAGRLMAAHLEGARTGPEDALPLAPLS